MNEKIKPNRKTKQRVLRDFRVVLLLTSLTPLLSAALIMRMMGTPGNYLQAGTVAGATLVLGTIGAFILWNNMRAIARAHTYLSDMIAYDTTIEDPRASDTTSWKIEDIAEMVVHRYRKQLLSAQSEKAEAQRRLYELTNSFSVPNRLN